MLGPLSDHTRRKRFAGQFDVVCLGGRSAHELEHADFSKSLADRATICVETARNTVVLSEDQSCEYERRVGSMAAGLGCVLEGTDRELLDDRFGLGSEVEIKGGKR